jgi:integrase
MPNISETSVSDISLSPAWSVMIIFPFVAVRKAGLPAGTTSHALRHHYASLLLAAGESVVAVAERLGHENATLVLTTYGHLMLDSEDRTRRAIDAAWTGDGLQTASGQD